MNDSKMAENLDMSKEDKRQLESELESFENLECQTKQILKLRNLVKTLLQSGVSKVEILEDVNAEFQTPCREKESSKNPP